MKIFREFWPIIFGIVVVGLANMALFLSYSELSRGFAFGASTFSLLVLPIFVRKQYPKTPIVLSILVGIPPFVAQLILIALASRTGWPQRGKQLTEFGRREAVPPQELSQNSRPGSMGFARLRI